jgi:hypothetical protein
LAIPEERAKLTSDGISRYIQAGGQLPPPIIYPVHIKRKDGSTAPALAGIMPFATDNGSHTIVMVFSENTSQFSTEFGLFSDEVTRLVGLGGRTFPTTTVSVLSGVEELERGIEEIRAAAMVVTTDVAVIKEWKRQLDKVEEWSERRFWVVVGIFTTIALAALGWFITKK